MITVRPAHEFHTPCEGRVVKSLATRHAPFVVSLMPNGRHLHVVSGVELTWVRVYENDQRAKLREWEPRWARPQIHFLLACGGWRAERNGSRLLRLEHVDPDLFVACPRCWPLGDGPLCSCSKAPGHRCDEAGWTEEEEIARV